MTSQFIVICDPVKQSAKNLLGRFLTYLDRGKYIRPEDDLISLIDSYFQILEIKKRRGMRVEGVCVLACRVYAILVLISVEYHVALTIATILGVLFNFKTTGTIVFRNNKSHLIFRFVAVYGIIYVLNQIVLTLLVKEGINELMGQAIVLPVMVALAYLMNKKFVFNFRILS